MLNLYSIGTKKDQSVELLDEGEKASVIYHDLFDFPLNFSDLIKWKVGKNVTDIKTVKSVSNRNGYYFLEDKVGVVYKRLLHKRISAKKLLIAKRAAKVISLIPFVKMIAITGSLAMENSTEDSDIDLMFVIEKDRLWTSRLFVYLFIGLFGIQRRRPHDKIQKDRLCLNMWMDESDLSWAKRERNIYTAHEIAQIVPLVNKDKTYEKFLYANKWALSYWPYAVSIKPYARKNIKHETYSMMQVVEKLAFKIQYQHMKSKISREVIMPTRALFHPQDWGRVVIKRLTT